MKEVLQVFAEEMRKLSIDYDYLEWKTTPIPNTYVIGEYSDIIYTPENNTSEGEMLVTVWNRVGSTEDVINTNEQIKKHFKDFKIIKNNVAISINYLNALPVLQESDLRKQEIRLDVQYWEGE
jgi:hypothetical protein